jgi:hypothetical protein
MNSYLGEGQAVQDVRDAAAIPTQDHCAVTARMAGLGLHISGAIQLEYMLWRPTQRPFPNGEVMLERSCCIAGAHTSSCCWYIFFLSGKIEISDHPGRINTAPFHSPYRIVCHNEESTRSTSAFAS